MPSKAEQGSSRAAAFVLAREKFGMRPGLARMHALLDRLGHPERRFPAIHVVGTNGKSTTTRMIEALLDAAGLGVGAYVSPHVVRWSERIRVRGEEADLDALVERVAPAIEAVDAELGDPVTQFEVLTAAALVAFADAAVDVVVVEAGLGGARDATNVIDAPVCVLTNVGLDHVEHLGDTREAIAGEKLAVVSPGAVVVLGEPEWEARALAQGAARVVLAEGNLGCAVAAAEAFLGRAVDPAPAAAVTLPGRVEVVARSPLELWDGAHNPHGARYLVGRLPRPPERYVLMASVLADKDVGKLLSILAEAASTLVATESTNARSLPAVELATRRGMGREDDRDTADAAAVVPGEVGAPGAIAVEPGHPGQDDVGAGGIGPHVELHGEECCVPAPHSPRHVRDVVLPEPRHVRAGNGQTQGAWQSLIGPAPHGGVGLLDGLDEVGAAALPADPVAQGGAARRLIRGGRAEGAGGRRGRRHVDPCRTGRARGRRCRDRGRRSRQHPPGDVRDDGADENQDQRGKQQAGAFGFRHRPNLAAGRAPGKPTIAHRARKRENACRFAP